MRRSRRPTPPKMARGGRTRPAPRGRRPAPRKMARDGKPTPRKMKHGGSHNGGRTPDCSCFSDQDCGGTMRCMPSSTSGCLPGAHGHGMCTMTQQPSPGEMKTERFLKKGGRTRPAPRKMARGGQCGAPGQPACNGGYRKGGRIMQAGGRITEMSTGGVFGRNCKNQNNIADCQAVGCKWNYNDNFCIG